MKHIKGKRIIILLTVLFLALMRVAVHAEDEISFHALLTGEFGFPVSVRISSPEYLKLAQFDDVRTSQINSLLKHFTVESSSDGNVSSSSVMIDEKTVYSMTETVENDKVRRIWSADPDTAYIMAITDPNEEKPMIRFQNGDFYPLNRLLDEARSVLEKAAEQFRDMGKAEKVSLNYKDYGKAVQRVTIRFAKEFVAEQFPDALASLADPTSLCRQFLASLSFDGVQRLILVLDEENHLIRATYDGNAGISSEELRKVSVTWKCLRTEDRLIDDLTVKTPAVKGYNKYNLTYKRDMDLREPDKHKLDWNLELDHRTGESRRRINYQGGLVFEDSLLTGNIIYTEKGKDTNVKTVLKPSVSAENSGKYSGTLEITDYSGKIVTSDILFQITANRCGSIMMPETEIVTTVDTSSPDGKRSLENLHENLSVLLIRSMMTLPKEDTLFLSNDIPDEVWNTLTQSLF